MKNSIAVFILSLLVCAGSAIAWPWGNVGLNVDEPTAQLDVGGDVVVRSNVVVRGEKITIGEGEGIYNPLIEFWNTAEGRFDAIGMLGESSFGFRADTDGTPYGWKFNGRIGGDVSTPWYGINGEGVVFGNEDESTNRASIKVSLDPPGFIFNVNGVIWTNTP